MKKHYFLKTAALLVLCCAMFGCGKDNPQASQTTTIYGTIFNKVTHEPVNGAQVEYGYYTASNILYNGYPSSIEYHRISSAISGYDGQYEMQFEEVQFDLDFNDGFYISATCNGFQGYHSSAVNGNGGVYRLDINLEPDEPAVESFKVTVNGVEIDTLDFGADPNMNKIGLLVTNDGTVSINEVEFNESAFWIGLENINGYDVSYCNNLKPNEGYVVYAHIYRSSLQIGNNNSYIYFSSGTLTKTIVVKAQGLEMPVVSNPILSNIQSYTTNVSASVTSDGGWQIVDKGFEYVDGDSYDSYVRSISCGPGISNFQTQVPVGSADHYYGPSKVRSYASNGAYTAYSGWVDIN